MWKVKDDGRTESVKRAVKIIENRGCELYFDSLNAYADGPTDKKITSGPAHRQKF